MQFSSVLLAGVAFAVAQAANFTMTASQFVSVETGSPFDITWTGAVGSVTLLLKNGASSDLKTVSTIASGLTGTSYTWTPDSSLVSGTYALEIDDDSGPNYSVQFTLAGSASSVSSSASSTSGSSSASSTSTGSSSSGSTTTLSSTSSSVTAASNLTSSTRSSSKTSASKTSTSTSTGSSTSTSSTSSPSSLSSASGLASPLAFILLAFAAIMTLN
ncbi:hypothetical protein BDZ45DRAFT_726732 [Acephala macrosclerotiorum]|nr:hypothetical protein BDZ45DRAFT_726732 [Acephala macrosclerotiorum]